MIGEDENGSVQIVRTEMGVKKKDDKVLWIVKFTLLVMHVENFLAQIKDEHYLKWSRPLHL